jgi:hypothetical protein
MDETELLRSLGLVRIDRESLAALAQTALDEIRSYHESRDLPVVHHFEEQK